MLSLLRFYGSVKKSAASNDAADFIVYRILFLLFNVTAMLNAAIDNIPKVAVVLEPVWGFATVPLVFCVSVVSCDCASVTAVVEAEELRLVGTAEDAVVVVEAVDAVVAVVDDVVAVDDVVLEVLVVVETVVIEEDGVVVAVPS